MNQMIQVIKANYISLRLFFLITFAVELISVLINLLIAMSGVDNSTQVSPGNIITVFLVVMPIISSLYLFKRLINLGATRRDYYLGTIGTYILVAAVFSVFNIIWFAVENHILNRYFDFLNIISIFHWNSTGIVGMFLYQFVAYLVVISFINLIVSCFTDRTGIILYIALIAVTSISMSIGTLRATVAQVLSFLLFNPVITVDLSMSMAVVLILFMCGWWFTRRRQVA
jgi:hypothetical protein